MLLIRMQVYKLQNQLRYEEFLGISTEDGNQSLQLSIYILPLVTSKVTRGGSNLVSSSNSFDFDM